MEELQYTPEKMENVRLQIQRLIGIVNELEASFPGRPFPLDGHLVGSIGEVFAAYYYGIHLYTASAEKHDGEVDGKRVQVKLCQQDQVNISSEPEHLIVLYLARNGEVYEVYNGPGELAWKSASNPDGHNNCHMRVNKLMELDKTISVKDRIGKIHSIEKMRTEYKNRRKL